MATILLQAAGAAIGGLLGSAGAAIGTAVGAVAGYMIDRALLGDTRHVHGPRLSGPRPLSAEEGQPIPRLYGTARLGATLIWATRFEEQSRTERQGGKGSGPKVTSYSYFANVALALCEGEIASVRRIWADGQEIDREEMDLRIYPGTADQEPDPLIEARQGTGNAPAYRGIAYVVLERFALEAYGNRIPQFQFEVIRPVGQFHRSIRAVALIPGATEYGLSPAAVTRAAPAYWSLATGVAGNAEALNRSVSFGASDLAASLDELQALCPALEHVALVTTWFGNDLRAGHCTLRPKIVHADAPEASRSWKVSGIGRGEAPEVSRHAGEPAYGGTPSDRSVMEAIAELKARGLKVTLYPFVMMDIAADNALPDPRGGEEQPAYPWRGRITCNPAPGLDASADATALAEAQIAAFCGSAEAGDFTASTDTIRFTGAADDWGYRRMILHHAYLAEAAGGVDAFLIGSELCGLTTLRGSGRNYPFVAELVRLAGEVKAILGADTAVTYGADWSEYAGHAPEDGSGDRHFHLDPLWASDAIDAIGIDNYFPLSDWRDSDFEGGNPDGATSPHDGAALRAALAGGEYHDWYYKTDADRIARLRTPIEDGAAGKPWVFRAKDLKGWWENAHHDRIGGVELDAPTAWVPCSKPFWFTELGCAAIDKAANQPNLFGDPKSAENGRPFFSTGGRDDFIQRAFLDAHLARWDASHDEFDPAANPLSPAYDGRMVDASRIYLWCWDTRPFPAFPRDTTMWSDGGNWACGHWLNGRLSAAAISDILQAILADHGLPPADTARVTGMLGGLVVDRPEAARDTIGNLADLCGFAARESGERLVFFDERAATEPPFAITDQIVPDDGATLTVSRQPPQEVPHQVALTFRDPLQDYQTVTVRHQIGDGWPSSGQAELALPICCETSRGEQLAAEWLARQQVARDRIALSLPMAARQIQPGSRIELPFAGSTAKFLVTAVEDGICRRIEARRVALEPPAPERAQLPIASDSTALTAGPPLATFLDLPMLDAGDTPSGQFRIAAWSAPWRSLVVSASPEETGFSERATLAEPATLGVLEAALAPGPLARRDHGNFLQLRLLGGELASASLLQVLNGANRLAVQCADAGWEILQFETAEEIAPVSWKLSGLLRGQLGTEDAMAAGALAGSLAVLLDGSVVAAGLTTAEIGLERRWRVQPSGLASLAATTHESLAIGGIRALTPLAPVHLAAVPAKDGGLDCSWIRRGRTDADSWLGPDIALGEESEAYRIRMRDGEGTLLREAETLTPFWHYPADALGADRALATSLRLEVRQLSTAVGEGLAASILL